MFEKVSRFVKETLPVRNLELLSKRIAEYEQAKGNEIPPEVKARYEAEKQMLIDLFGDPAQKKLKRNLFFHGTGLLKYYGKKYKDYHNEAAERIDFNRTEFSLQKILTEGLIPQPDIFQPEGNENATSLVESYFYAKAFAYNNMADPEELKFQYGKPSDWATYLLADTAKCELWRLDKYLQRLYINRTKIWKTMKERKSKASPVVLWASGTRNNVGPETPMMDILLGRTTIPENWGAVLCIEKSGIQTKKAGAHETRTFEIIPPRAIVAVGVPFKRLDEARKLLDQVHSNAALFSLEGAEIHLSLFPMTELARRLE